MDFLSRWISKDTINDRISHRQCVLCGWDLKAGKGQSVEPLSTAKGAECCKWCFEHTVLTARKQINETLNVALQISGAEKARQDVEKKAMND